MKKLVLRCTGVAVVLLGAVVAAGCANTPSGEYLDQPAPASLLSDRWVNGAEELWEIPGYLSPRMMNRDVAVAVDDVGTATAYDIGTAYREYSETGEAVKPNRLWTAQIPMYDYPGDTSPILGVFGGFVLVDDSVYSLEDGSLIGAVPWTLSDHFENMEIYGDDDAVLVLQDPVNTFHGYNTDLELIWEVETQGAQAEDDRGATRMNVVEINEKMVALVEKDGLWQLFDLRDGSMRPLPDQPKIDSGTGPNRVESYRDGWLISPDNSQSRFLVDADGTMTTRAYTGPFPKTPFAITPEGWRPTIADALFSIDTGIGPPQDALSGWYFKNPKDDECSVVLGDGNVIDMDDLDGCEFQPIALSPDHAVVALGQQDQVHLVNLRTRVSRIGTDIYGNLSRPDLIIVSDEHVEILESGQPGGGHWPVIRALVPKGTVKG